MTLSARPISVDIVVLNTVASNPDNEINHANAELFDEFNIYCTTSSSSSSNDYFENEYFNECSKTDSNLSTKLKEWARKPRALFELYDSDNDMFKPEYHSTDKSEKTNHKGCKNNSDNDMFEPAYHSTDKTTTKNHTGYTNNSDKDIMVELNSSAREISQNGRSQGEMTFNDTVNLSTIANLMQKQFKATLYINCLLEQLLKSKVNNQTIQPASSLSIQEKFRSIFHNLPLNSLEDVVEMKNKLKDPVSQHLMKNRLRQCGC
ncbi:hypothetical protein AGLY_015689 [Aphis glycines]|uniref:Uncharacterized protein n=1 Tax=Aphis glycines TaxID=307491 RepID=A0A6G0T0K9_APHGL|nr:hypothetical protein AGLY_015689 [Aphis glycines]